jgi:cysteine desulfurase
VWEFTRTFRHFGFDVRILNPDARGIIRPEEVERQLSPDTLAVAVMAVNNEIGSIQPLSEIVERVRSYERSSGAEIRIHCDAVQALGKIDLSPEELGVDTMAFSAHKLGGPKGVGMLYTRAPLNVLSPAGGQEGGLRGGTENVSGIHGLSLAVERAVAARIEGHTRMRELKQRIAGRLDAIEGLRLLPSAVLEEAGHFSPYILSFTAAPVPGEVLVRVMDDRGFSISTGSACSANSRKKRHRVLKAIGIDDADAAGAVRISWGSSVEASQLESFCATVQRELPLLRKTAGVR